MKDFAKGFVTTTYEQGKAYLEWYGDIERF